MSSEGTDNPIMAQGAAFGALPLMDRFEGDVTQLIKAGDHVQVQPRNGVVIVARGA